MSVENKEEKQKEFPFKQGDRVSRPNVLGPSGTVQKVRVEITRETLRRKEGQSPAITVSVLWDNGTLSHFTPEGLKKVS